MVIYILLFPHKTQQETRGVNPIVNPTDFTRDLANISKAKWMFPAVHLEHLAARLLPLASRN